MKKCNCCKIEKNLIEFSKNQKRCRKCTLNANMKSHWKHREKRLLKQRQYAKNNKEKIRIKNKIYNSKPTTKEKNNQREKNKRKTNINYRITCSLRSRLNLALKGKTKTDSTFNLIGCSREFLLKYLELWFEVGMNWNNYGKGIGKWTIGHINPCRLFNLSNKEEQLKCFNYTNLIKPEWWSYNCSKADKLPDGSYARFKN